MAGRCGFSSRPTPRRATGTIHSTCGYESFSGPCQPLTGNENLPTTILALAGYNSSTAYYEYGFTWTASRVTWWIVHPTTGQRITLWDYQGPASRIPPTPPTT